MSSLIKCYGLNQELLPNIRPQKSASSDLSKLSVSVDALSFAILHKIDPVSDFVINFYKGGKELNRPTTTRQLTPLHIAAITGHAEAAQKLIDAGANIDVYDLQHWTPLHHAALAGNVEMINLLLKNHAKGDLETRDGATFKKILELTRPLKVQSTDPIPLVWKDQKGERQLTREEFKKFASAEFLDENKISPELMQSEWADLNHLPDEFVFTSRFKEDYLAFLKDPLPVHVLAQVDQDSQGQKLKKSPGLGLFAKKDISAGQIIGEYQGELLGREAKSNFALDNCESKSLRSAIPHVNDGFNNSVLISIHHVNGLPTRYVLVAAENIKAGDQFCWNYGPHGVKFGLYSELRSAEARDFLKKEKFDELMQCLDISNKTGQLKFEDFVRAEKIRYLVNTPSVLFLMILEGMLDESKAQKLHSLAYKYGRIATNTPPILRFLVDIAFQCKAIKKQLAVHAPKIAAAYEQYFMSLPAKASICYALDFTKQTNIAIIQKLEGLQSSSASSSNEATLSKLWAQITAHGEKLIDKVSQIAEGEEKN